MKSSVEVISVEAFISSIPSMKAMGASMKTFVGASSMKATIISSKALITSMKACMEAFVEVIPVDAFVDVFPKVAFVEVFVKAFVEVTSVEGFIPSIFF